jgi:hypothetical protein
VRPTDEDQSGSRRPNLMSPTRRTASETNILAMLERHQSAGPGRRLLRGLRGVPAMAWYGAAGVLVMGLVGSLAWLARDSGTPVPADSALAGATVPSAPVAASPPLNAPATVSAGASAEVVAGADAALADPPAAAGATIVDVAPAEPAPSAEALPVPRELAPQQHAGRILARDGRPASQHDRQHDRQHDAQRLAGAPKTARAEAGKAASATRAQAQAHAETRSRRPAAAPKQAPAAVDTDVALITAIIQHATKRQDAEDAARKP